MLFGQRGELGRVGPEDEPARARAALGRHGAGTPGPVPMVRVEARPLPGVARPTAVLVHQHHERVAIAVDAHLAHVLSVPGGLALLPVLLAAAAVEPRTPRRKSASQGLGVHVGHGQHRPVGGVLHDRRHQAVGLGEVDGAHQVPVDRERHALGNGGGLGGPGPGPAQR